MKKKILRIATTFLCSVLALSSVFACGEKEQKPSSGGTNVHEAVTYGDEGIDKTKTVGKISAQTPYTIVIPRKYAEAELTASSELLEGVYKTTGLTLEVAFDDEVTFSSSSRLICLGKTKFTEKAEFDYSTLEWDGFYIKTVNGNVIVDGYNDRGTLYGAYDFLEQFAGIKFLTYNYTHYPKLTEIEIYETDRLENPAFKYRSYLSGATHFPTTIQTQKYTSRMRIVHEFMHLGEAYGGDMGWVSSVGQVHNSMQYVDWEQYYDYSVMDIKPEYKDMFYYSSDGPYENVVDICFTNGVTDDGQIDETMEVSALKAAIAGVKKAILDEPEATLFMFGQTDTTLVCDCNRCVEAANKYKRSGIMIRFVNLINREIQAWMDETYGDTREVSLIMFAYSYIQDAPVTLNADGGYELLDPTCKIDDEVYLRIAPIYADRRYSYTDERQRSDSRILFESWKGIASKYFVWTYEHHYSKYYIYLPTMQTWRDNLLMTQDYGAEYVMLQSSYNDIGNFKQHMDAYIACKLLWDPYRDVNALRDEFIYYFFGSAAYEKTLDYFDRYDAYYEMVFGETGYRLDADFDEVENHSVVFLERQVKILDEAMALVKADDGLTEAEKSAYVENLKNAQITPRATIMYYYNEYEATSDGLGYHAYCKAVLDDMEHFGWKIFGEHENTLALFRKNVLGE